MVRVIQGVTGQLLCTLDLEGSSGTVQELKRRIAETEGTPTPMQKLIVNDTPGGRVLDVREKLPSTKQGPLQVALLRVRPEPSDPTLHEDLRLGRVDLQALPEELRQDRQVVISACASKTASLRLAAPELRADRELVLHLLHPQHWRGTRAAILEILAPELHSDPEVARAVVRLNGMELEKLPEPLRANPNVVLVAVQQAGNALEFAAAALRADRQLVTEAIQQDGRALRFAAEALKQDPELVFQAMGQMDMVLAEDYLNFCGWEVQQAMRYAQEELRSDPEIVHTVVQLDGLSLEYAADQAKADRRVALAAVRENYLALRFVAEPLKMDRIFGLQAVRINWRCLELLHASLQADKVVVSAALRSDWRALALAAPEIRRRPERLLGTEEPADPSSPTLAADAKFMLAAIEREAAAFRLAARELREDRAFVLAAVQRNGLVLAHVGSKWRGDPDLAGTACMQALGSAACGCMKQTGWVLLAGSMMAGVVAVASAGSTGVCLIIGTGIVMNVGAALCPGLDCLGFASAPRRASTQEPLAGPAGT